MSLMMMMMLIFIVLRLTLMTMILSPGLLGDQWRPSPPINMIADIYISISTGTFDIENIKYEKKWQQLDLDTNFEP